jgi:hypothetical protein
MRKLAAIVPWLLVLAGSWTVASPAVAQRNERAPRSVSGRVVNAENQPLAKAVVYLKDTKSLAIRSYITQQDGAFKFSALAPNVDYEVYADFQGTHSNVKTLGAFDERKQAQFTLKIRSVR